MKNLLITIIAFAILLLVPVLMNHPANALCMPTSDWPAAPCYGDPADRPSKEKERQDWAPYYQYKGAGWMEMMKTQMIEAMKNGTLEDWVSGNQSNYNVWRYYYVNDQAPFFRSSVTGLNDERPYFPSPLKQLTTGIDPKDVSCGKSLDLVIKVDGSPACVRYTTAYVLIERGWARESVSTMTSLEPTVIIPTNSSIISNRFTFAPSVVKTVFGINNTVRWINMDSVANVVTSDTGDFRSGLIEPGYAWTHTFDKAGTYGYHSDIHPWLKGTVIVTANPLADLANDTGTVTLSNQTYYFETPIYIHDAYFKSPQISFHDVTFTLFPSGFRGGLPTSCGEQYYWTDAKFSDNMRELLHIFAGPKCPVLPAPIHFTNHIHPQAGLVFYDGKMKLLVSANATNANGTELPASFMPCDTPFQKSNTGVAVLYMPVNSIGKICLKYYNPNDDLESMSQLTVFDPNSNNGIATNITTWNDMSNTTISPGYLYAVYGIKTGNQTGLYGIGGLGCVGTPFAVGYDNNSRIVASDFHFLWVTVSCQAGEIRPEIDSMTGIGVKYIPFP